jgi:hypothetical protein
MSETFPFRRRIGVVLGLACLNTLFACAAEPPPAPYEFVLNIEADPGQPLAGAKVFQGKKEIGLSAADGLVHVFAHGAEGSSTQFTIECPEGHKSPAQPVSAILRRGADARRPPQLQVQCPAALRNVVVAIRAVNGPNLPVLHLGQPVARTDAAGAAHVHLKATPADVLQLVLDTSSNPELRPQNPTQNFEVPSQDQLFVFDHEFVVDKPKVAVRARRRAAPSGPIRIVGR